MSGSFGRTPSRTSKERGTGWIGGHATGIRTGSGSSGQAGRSLYRPLGIWISNRAPFPGSPFSLMEKPVNDNPDQEYLERKEGQIANKVDEDVMSISEDEIVHQVQHPRAEEKDRCDDDKEEVPLHGFSPRSTF